MDQIWKTVLAIIGSVGGAGIIIAFIGKWLAQLIADRVIQSKQHQMDVELAEMHSKYELVLEQYRTKAAEYTYISQIQFETEFKVYQSLFQSLYVFGSSTAVLFPEYDSVPMDLEERKNYILSVIHGFVQRMMSFHRSLSKMLHLSPSISMSHLCHF